MPADVIERPRTVDVGLYRVGEGRHVVRVYVKRTYDLVHGRRMTRSRREQLSLHFEPTDENADGAEPVDCPVSECDLTPRKLCTDIVVHGHVRSPGAVSITSMRAAARIGECWKHVSVIGDRRVSWRAGTRPSFGAPEPFVEIPLTWRRAFGGIDASVPPREATGDVLELLSALTPARHPGAYPRNPAGVGWVVNADRRRLDGLRLPNFEAPEHPLTPDRLVAGTPDRWPWSPEPAGFGWLGQAWFPRSTLLGLGPAVESLPGHLRHGWLELAPKFVGGPDPRFYSGASSGMRHGLRGDEPVELHGFRHEGPVCTALPGEHPRLTLLFRRQPLAVTTQLNTIELLPDRELATLAWVIEAPVPHVLPLSFPGAGAESFDMLEGFDVLLDGVALAPDGRRCADPSTNDSQLAATIGRVAERQEA